MRPSLVSQVQDLDLICIDVEYTHLALAGSLGTHGLWAFLNGISRNPQHKICSFPAPRYTSNHQLYFVNSAELLVCPWCARQGVLGDRWQTSYRCTCLWSVWEIEVEVIHGSRHFCSCCELSCLRNHCSVATWKGIHPERQPRMLRGLEWSIRWTAEPTHPCWGWLGSLRTACSTLGAPQSASTAL